MRTAAHFTPEPPADLTLDLTLIRNSEFRAEVRRELKQLGQPFKVHRFLSTLSSFSREESHSSRLVVMADLANLAAFYEKAGRSSWTSCVQRNNMLVVAFVRHRRDEHFAYLVDDLVRASTCRFWVFSIGRPARRHLHESLSKFMGYLDPEAVIAVRYSERDRTIWIEFADGLRRAVPWASLNLMDISPALRPESIRLGSSPDTIELLDSKGQVFDVDAAAIRALVDPKVAKAHFAVAERAALTLGERLRLRREQAGLTQTALAERSGLPQEMISDLERGQHEPRFATLEKYARGLGLSTSDLLSGTARNG